MNVSDAVNDIVRKLHLLDDRQLVATGTTLANADLTWGEWTSELALRITYLIENGPSQDVLDALGALVIAFKVKLAAAEETRVDTGAEAA